MAIEPKSPRKRAVKKVSKKKSLTTDTSTEIVDAVSVEATENKRKKKAPAIPVPIFQAAPEEKAPKTVRKSVGKVKEEESAPESAATSEDDDSRGGRNRRRRRG